MRIAIPLDQGKVAEHFGHCEQFAIIDAEKQNLNNLNIQKTEPPPHEPGKLPEWLRQHGAKLIISGGMGSRAQNLFKKHGIDVIIGATDQTPQDLVKQYFQGKLSSGENLCDH
jgi:ATP-binding protein involved in chromosome partitioning